MFATRSRTFAAAALIAFAAPLAAQQGTVRIIRDCHAPTLAKILKADDRQWGPLIKASGFKPKP